MKKLSFIASMVFTFIITVTPVKAQTFNIDPNCAYILIDGKTGQVIAEQNADVKLRPASTTKILTALVALEQGKLDQQIKVSQQAVNDIGNGGMNIGIMADEEGFTLENMLNVMLIKSANETANIVAENVGGTRAAFIEKMNKRAAELGAVNTTFYNTCGMDDTKEYQQHLTTARDMAIIARQAMTIPKFREIVSKEYYNNLPATNKHTEWPSLRNTNKLLWDNNEYPYTASEVEKKYKIIGMKTGYTSGAGYNLISAGTNEDGTELIAAVMHVTEGNNAINTYTKELFAYGFQQYGKQEIVNSNDILPEVTVIDAKDDEKLKLQATNGITAVMPLDKSKWNIEKVQHINENIKAPINQGDKLGYIEYKSYGIVVGKVDLIAGRSVEKSVKVVMVEKSKNFIYNIITSPILRIIAAIIILLLVRKHIRRANAKKRRQRYMEKRFKQ